MRFADELLGSEGERCEVSFNVDGCSYVSQGVIEAVVDNGRAASVRFDKQGYEFLHGGYMAAVPFERITLLDSEDRARALKRLNDGLPVTVMAHGIECQVKSLGKQEVDRTTGQHEDGWWVCLIELADDPERDETDEWFLSSSGILYGHTDRASKNPHSLGYRVWDEEIGLQVAMHNDALTPNIVGYAGGQRIEGHIENPLACHIDESAGLAGGD